MLLREVVCGLGLYGGDAGGVEVAAGDCTLCEELCAALEDVVVEVVGGFGLVDFEACAGQLFRRCGLGSGGVRALGSEVGAFVVGGSGFEVFVLERGDDLTGANMRAALDVESFDRGRNLGLQCGLRYGSEDGVGSDLFADGAHFRVFDLNAGDGLFVRRLSLLAAGEQQ